MSKELRHKNIIWWGKVFSTELLSPASIVSPWHGQSLGYPRAESVLVPHGWHQRLKPHFVDAGLLGFQKSLAGLASNT